MSRVRVSVPASSGNLGSGFDVLAAALDLRLELEVRKGGAGFIIEGEGADSLPRDGKNLVARILKRHLGSARFGVRLTSEIPLGRGLGSSGAARLAAHAAGLALSGKEWSGALALAAQDEGHPDNVAASFYGGLTAVLDPETLAVHRFQAPKGLRAVVCVPDFQLATATARGAIPEEVPLSDAVFNLSRLSAWFAAIESGDWKLLKLATQDALHQPYRRALVPGLREAVDAALAAGAFGACLSGAGPSVLAVCGEKADLEKVGRAMASCFVAQGKLAWARILAFDTKGMAVRRG